MHLAEFSEDERISCADAAFSRSVGHATTRVAMTLRCALAVALVPFILVACGGSTRAPSGAGGASPDEVHSGAAGSSDGGAKALSGGTGAGLGGTGAGSSTAGVSLGGASASSSAAGAAGLSAHGGAAQSTSGGQAGGPASGGSAALVGGGGGATGGSSSAGGNAGDASGVPPRWLTVTDVDYSKIPGPNFETVRLMFEGVPCSGSSCHYGGRNHLQVGKSADDLYKYMIGFKTLQCGKLIDTAHPSESAIVKYLRGPCGGIERMPSYSCTEDTDEACVPEYYIQAIEQWIANGAPR